MLSLIVIVIVNLTIVSSYRNYFKSYSRPTLRQQLANSYSNNYGNSFRYSNGHGISNSHSNSHCWSHSNSVSARSYSIGNSANSANSYTAINSHSNCNSYSYRLYDSTVNFDGVEIDNTINELSNNKDNNSDKNNNKLLDFNYDDDNNNNSKSNYIKHNNSYNNMKSLSAKEPDEIINIEELKSKWIDICIENSNPDAFDKFSYSNILPIILKGDKLVAIEDKNSVMTANSNSNSNLLSSAITITEEELLLLWKSSSALSTEFFNTKNFTVENALLLINDVEALDLIGDDSATTSNSNSILASITSSINDEIVEEDPELVITNQVLIVTNIIATFLDVYLLLTCN